MASLNGLKKHLGVKCSILLAVLSVLLLTGAVGMVVYGVFIQVGGPVWVRNQYIGLWLSSLIFFFSAQGVYLILKSPRNIKNNFYFMEIGYFALCLLLSAVMTVCYGLAKKIDATVWSVLLVAINALIVTVLVTRRKLSMEVGHADGLTGSNDDASCGIRCVIRTLRIVNLVLKIFFLLFLALLTTGSVIIGGLTIAYPPRGQFTTVQLEDGTSRKLKIHHLCDGPEKSDKPTFVFEGSGSHGLMDYYGLQTLLKARNRRSCIFDNAGLGYSDYMYTDMYNAKPYYHNFFKSIVSEKPPYIFVGWGGGGATVYEYALEHPDMVQSITFLDVAPAQIEWLTPKVLKNWTQDEFERNKKKDIAGRSALFGVINGLGVPWGLMSIFAPKTKSYPPETENEVHWYFLTDKTWSTQRQYLKKLADEVDPYNKTLNNQPNSSPNAFITVNHIMTVKSDEQIVDSVCKQRKLAANSTDCEYEIKANRLSVEWRRNLYKFNSIVECTADACDLGYYVYTAPNYTVNALLNLYP